MHFLKNDPPTSRHSHAFRKSRLLSWVATARLPTLVVSWAPVVLAFSSLAREKRGMPEAIALLCCILASSTCIQIATNLWNDYLDFKKGNDTTSRLGPERASASGQLPPSAVKQAAYLVSGLAVFFGTPLVLKGGLPIAALGLVALFLAYAYSAGSWGISRLGISEWFVLAFFGPFAYFGTLWILTESLPHGAFGLSIALGTQACVPLLINQIRDVEEDRQTGKRTSTVRFGTTFSQIELALSLAWPALLLLGADLRFGILYSLGAFYLLFSVIRTKPSRQYNQFLKLSTLLYALWCFLWIGSQSNGHFAL